MKALSLLGIAGLFLLAGSVPADAQVINEILADPWHLPGGDANGDNGGAEGHFIEDEFVEIYNNSGADLDMSGWEIQDNGNPVHVFPPGTVVADQCAIVVFGGGTPTGAFGGAVVQTSSTGNLSLSNSGATLSLVDAGAVEVVSETYDGDNPDTGQNTSITRDPDITGGFVQHSDATGSDGALFSPGTKIDGSLFSGCEISEPACGEPAAGDCFEANGTPFCSDGECCDAVCAGDPFCCDNDWNATCADEALVECRSCGDSETGDCFEDNGTPYCSEAECCSLICDPNNPDGDESCCTENGREG
ncbi:MAG: lamin tail domain-containing protein [Planctomycetes bacterium]|nr:lamin tail domain-containing protein [Planctomycetota bacterium]